MPEPSSPPVTVPPPAAVAKRPVPPELVNVPVKVWAAFAVLAPTSQTVPVSDWFRVSPFAAVIVPDPLAGAQYPPAPLDVASAQTTVSVDVYEPVPMWELVATPSDCTVQPVNVNWQPAALRLVSVPEPDDWNGRLLFAAYADVAPSINAPHALVATNALITIFIFAPSHGYS